MDNYLKPKDILLTVVWAGTLYLGYTRGGYYWLPFAGVSLYNVSYNFSKEK